VTDKEVDVKQEVIDGVAEKLAKEGTFATRDFVHSELMDAMKSVTLTPNKDVDGELTPKQEAEGKAAWYKQVIGYGREWNAKAWDSTTSGAAAELIPSVVANSIIKKLDFTPFRKYALHYPYSPKGTINVELVLPIAYRMTTRGTPVTEAAPTLNPINYATYGLMAWMGVDNKLIKEATPNVVNYIEDALVRAVARKEMTEWTLGAGSGSEQMTGMYSTADAVNMTSGHDTLAEIDAADVLSLYWALEAGYSDNAVLMAPNTVLAKIASLNTTTVTYLNTDTMKFLGNHDVLRMPSTSFAAPGNGIVAAYFGDPNFFYLFEDGPIVVATTDQGKTAMTEDRTFVCAKVYTDGHLILGEAVKALKYLT